MPTLFLSYAMNANTDRGARLDVRFVLQVAYWLRAQGIDTKCCATFGRTPAEWTSEGLPLVSDCHAFVYFQCADGVAAEGEGQRQEHAQAVRVKRKIIIVKRTEAPASDFEGGALKVIEVRGVEPADARLCAREAARALELPWRYEEDLPVVEHPIGATLPGSGEVSFPFQHEKDILRTYLAGAAPPAQLVERGFPPKWPRIQGGPAETKRTTVLAMANSEFDPSELIARGMRFPAAGRVKDEQLPARENRFNVGVLVSGGIAPGINAVISGIVERHHDYGTELGQAVHVYAYPNGFQSLNQEVPTVPADKGYAARDRRKRFERWILGSGNDKSDELKVHANQGGSLIGTSRIPHLNMAHVVANLAIDDIKILYIIGGDGSMRAAHALWQTARAQDLRIAVVGIPKTIDNDILWVWQSFGFQSAAQQSKEIIDRLWTEVSSNPRLAVVQLYGSDSGFVVADAASASGNCDLFLTPEMRFDMEWAARTIDKRFRERSSPHPLERNHPHGLVVMAETALPVPADAQTYMAAAYDDITGLTAAEKTALGGYLSGPRLSGRTPDELRSGALKLVANILAHLLRQGAPPERKKWPELRPVLLNEPRHLIRSQLPSSSDILMGRRLGAHAVDGAMAGYEDFMISHWLTEYVMVPLKLVVLGRKRMPKGSFYSFAAKVVGQPDQPP